MPRKSSSTGRLKSEGKTSLRLAIGAKQSPFAKKRTEVKDGGKWAGQGAKVADRREGPQIRMQPSGGRGPRARRTTKRKAA